MELKTLTQLQKNLKKDASPFPVFKLAVVGDCSTQLLCTALKGTAYDEGINLRVFEADYDQLQAQLMDKESELHAFGPRAVLIYLCTEKLYEAYCGLTQEARSGFADMLMEKISSYWDRAGTIVLQTTFIEADDRVFGNFAARLPSSFLYQVKRLNLLIMEGCQRQSGVFIIDINGLAAKLGYDRVRDPRLYYHAKLPLTATALPYAAKEIIDVIKAVEGRVMKCVVCDLDNTLWGGVIGDDGLEGIELGELGDGAAFTALQRWLKELKNRGIILCVCSKNEEAAAKEPFEKHPDMVLRLEDISVFIANWQDKAANIRLIQKTLDIGMDSLVFIDDNPFEREAVRSLIPEICVTDLPEDPAEYLPYLQSLNLFETASFSEEDSKRTEQYRAEFGRVRQQELFSSYEHYLKSLEMTAEAEPFSSFWFPRIAQLTQRSNQFNLRTVRYTEADIARLAEDEGYVTLYFTLKDNFGDYGLIAVVILEKQADNLFIHEWLMSCRVLKRGMEEFIADKILSTAAELGFKTVTGEYIPTKKNAMVAQLYEKLGFSPLGGGLFRAEVKNYTPHKTYIKEAKAEMQ
ncbi:MAG: HAD-IIIC family phosphatase [Papillibacter sp.]|nr:HAD-IIIC family phosphatase [Papillibacter sp.]